MHFFSPANVMRLLEIVRGRKTGKDVIATCMQLSKKIGKIGVLVGNCRGFVGNRMFLPYIREAQFLVEEGATPEAVDAALTDWGMAMGPLAVGDLGGLDIAYRIRKEYRHLEKPGTRQPYVEDRLVEMGRLGQKTGAGWYKYDADRRASSDPEVAELVRKWRADAGTPQRQISSEEIVERCVYWLINEGARILEEGYALRAGDIDTIYVNGYGFPGIPRRPDVVCRRRRAEENLRPRLRISPPARPNLGACAIAQAASRGRQNLRRFPARKRPRCRLGSAAFSSTDNPVCALLPFASARWRREPWEFV